MDALTAVAQRHSTREYQAQSVPQVILEQIVDAGRRAPSAMNVQPWEFVVVSEAAVRRAVAECTDFGKFIAQAGACIAVFCKDGPYCLEDGCAATTTMLLAATALGVDSCWVAGDKKAYAAAVAQCLGVPRGYRLISLIALGYAAKPTGPTSKRPLNEVLHWERF